MKRPMPSLLTRLLLAAAALAWGAGQGGAAAKTDTMPQMTPKEMMDQKVKPAQRKAAATSLKAAKAAAVKAGTLQPGALTAVPLATDPVTGALVPDYFGAPNWAFSPPLHKFLSTDPLPDLKSVIATPDIVTYPGSDYYEVELFQGTWTFHTDLGVAPFAPTKLRMYRQTNNGTKTPCATTPCTSADNTKAPPPASYLGPVILATKGRPTRIKFTNNLPAGVSGNLFIPTDTTVMGAGTGPDGTNYPQNRGTLHLHGGFTPWVSDGTPHQWVTPTAEAATLKTGVSTQGVPDMDLPSGNSMTFYWPNQQSGRLMFYHDHAYGITRLNVYAGEAAGYLVRDAGDTFLEGIAGFPGLGQNYPLVIQDRTFVWGTPPATCGATTPGTGTFETDPTWCDPIRHDNATGAGWGQSPGSLWFPHVYMPNQNPWDVSGANALGRWDYALWFWPPFTGLLANGTKPNPYYDCFSGGPCTSPWEPPEIPGTPNPSLVPEAFMDTPVVNGKAYPTLSVPAGPVRLRILNAANDRFQNLSLWVAADNRTQTTATAVAGLPTLPIAMCTGSVPVANCTEVKMVPFNSLYNNSCPAPGCFPANWYTPGNPIVFDDRAGGVPDPATRGPAMVQIGNEGGLLPAPAVILNQPVNYTYNPKNIVVLSVEQHALLLGPAERADVVVDFSAFAGHTLILYNDAPAPIPAYDQRLDYFTGDPDQTASGGAPTTLPGMGPNTRTIMQIVVGSGTANPTPDFVNAGLLTALSDPSAGLPRAFKDYQDPIVVPQSAYNLAYGTGTSDVPGANLSRISDTALNFLPLAQTCVPGTYPCTLDSALTITMGSKAIQELFELDYGRMNATLGVEIPFTNGGNQTTIPYGYIDPQTEILDTSLAIAPPSLGDGTQIWKITHNGVDTHAIHFHLFNVQVINRVGWDGAIRNPDPNELGWKETVRMNPLEDIIVAMRPTTPVLPFGLPESVRPLDVTTPLGSTGQFTNLDPLGNPVTVVNALTNFGWEYVWHCHLLGHEENDMMRPIEFQPDMVVIPAAPTGPPSSPTVPTAVYTVPPSPALPGVVLTWGDPTPFDYVNWTGSAWGNVQNEVGFVIQRATSSSFNKPTSFSARANRTSFMDTTAQSNTAYYYRVQAFNAAGSSPWSATATLTTPAGTVPAAPSALTATVMSAAQVRLAWTDNSTNETGFVVERSTNGGAFSAFPTLAKNTVTYNDNSVAVGQAYAYRVKAVNGGTSSPYSNTASVTTNILAPSNLTGTVLSVTSVRLDWKDNANNEANYKVERSPDGSTWTVLTATLLANTITYTDGAVPAPGTYVYRVTATNGGTVSSSPAQITVGVGAPAAPSALKGTAVALGGNKRAVVLSWIDNSNNETSFTIERCTGTILTTCGPTGAWAAVTTTVAANATTYQDGGVVKAKTYSYRMLAVNPLGSSPYSNVATVSTP